MVVCKFFLQGTCKFGSACRYEHEINDQTNNQSNSILRAHYAQQQPAALQASNANKADVDTLVRSVQNDMLNAERGGQWLLSSYAPFKEKPAFPGFEDKSFEEIRLAYYEATKTGSVEQYNQQMQGLLHDALMRIRVLQNPNPTIVNLLKDIYNTPVKSATAGIFQLQGGTITPNMSIFSNQNQAPPQPSVFNTNQNMYNMQQPPQQSIFGGGGNNQQGIFGGSAPINNAHQQQQQQPQQNIFGGATSINPHQQSIFGVNPANQQQASVFSQPPPQQQSIFSNNVAAVNPAPQANIFGSQINQQGNVFASQPAANPPPSANIFNNQMYQNPPVIQPMSQPSVFGQVQVASNSILKPPVSQTVPFDESYYSKMEDLTEEELKAFQSGVVVMGKIPIKPPPYNLCL